MANEFVLRNQRSSRLLKIISVCDTAEKISIKSSIPFSRLTHRNAFLITKPAGSLLCCSSTPSLISLSTLLLFLTVLGIEDYYVDAHSLILKFNTSNYRTLQLWYFTYSRISQFSPLYFQSVLFVLDCYVLFNLLVTLLYLTCMITVYVSVSL